MLSNYFSKGLVDEKDRKIISILHDDGRASIAHIAKRCRISKQTAVYRISRLERNHIIKEFHTKVNFHNLGLTTYYVLLQTEYIDDEEEFIRSVKQISGCIYLWKSVSNYSYGIKIISADGYTLHKSLHEFYKRTRRVIGSLILSKAQKINTIFLDDIDIKIVEELYQDCRKSSLEISRKIGVHHETVQKRIKRLMHQNILDSFMIFIDYAQANLTHYTLLVKINHSYDDSMMRFEELLKGDSAVIRKQRVMGSYDYIINMIGKDSRDINNKISAIKKDAKESILEIQILPNEYEMFFGLDMDDVLKKK